MKQLLVGAAALALLTGSALAQATTTTTTTTTTISPEQETQIREYVVQEKPSAATLPAGVTLSVGAELPADVELREFSGDVGVTGYRYVVVDGRTVLVEPDTRRVVRIIEAQ